MRFQDAVRFSLELMLPEKAVRSIEKTRDVLFSGMPSLAERKPAAPDPLAPLRALIEEIDRARYGGLSFGPETIERMATALQRALMTLPEPADAIRTRILAESILRTAGNGERDPGRLAAIALADLGPIKRDA